MVITKKEIYQTLRTLYYTIKEEGDRGFQYSPLWDWKFTVRMANGETLFTCCYKDDSCYTEYRVDSTKVLVSELKWIARCFGDHIKECNQ